MKSGRSAAAIFLLLLLLAYGTAWNEDARTPLYPGKPLSAILERSPANYSFDLKAGEYFRLSIQKNGAGVALSILRPDGGILRSYPCSQTGPLNLLEFASTSGRYGVQFNPCGLSRDPVIYKLHLSLPGAAKSSDWERVTAERLTVEAEQLVAEYRADSRTAAIRKYKDASGKWRALGDGVGEADALINIAKLYRDLGDPARSFQYANAAAVVARNCRSAAHEAESLLVQASLHLNQGNRAKAQQLSAQALEIARRNSDLKSMGEARYLEGLILYESAFYAEAAEALEEAKQIALRRGDPAGLAHAILYLAAIDFDQMRFDTARDKGQEALALFRALRDRRGEAMALTYLGHFQSALEHKQKAMELYQEAMHLTADSGDAFTESSLFNGIATVHFELGDVQSALQFLKLALRRNHVLGDRIGIAYTLLSLGGCYYASSDLRNAVQSLQQARETFRSLSNRRMEGYLMADIATVLDAMGKPSEALAQLKECLQIALSLQDRRMEAWGNMGIGLVYEKTGQLDPALQSFERALPLYEVTEDGQGRMNVLYRMARCMRRRGRQQEALALCEKALSLSESFRSRITNFGLRTSYFASMHQQYSLLIDLLMQQDPVRRDSTFAIAAFEASEQSRARTLLDCIRETSISISEGADPRQVDRYETLKARLDAKASQYAQLRSTQGNTSTLAGVKDEIGRLTAELNMLQGQIRDQNPRYAALTQPEWLTLEQLQKELLDEDSLLLEYALGEESSWVWAVTRNSFAGFLLPKQSEIEAKVRQVRECLTARSKGSTRSERSTRSAGSAGLPRSARSAPAGAGDFPAKVKAAEARYPQVAAELSRMLLGPVADRLASRRLIFVTEGALQYVPLAALPAPSLTEADTWTPLLVEHEIVNLPSASTLAVIRREAQARSRPDRVLAVFADPVFEKSDIRVRKRGGSAPSQTDLRRLLSTQREADAILAMVPEAGRLAVTGFRATKAAAMSPDLKRYRIIHFATHAILNDDYPDLSSLELSMVDEEGNPQNGHLRLNDIYNLNLSADLVVLSACDTALGKEIKGEGLISLVRGFMYSGTPRVMASLWKVDDQATAELMKEFYGQMFEHKLTPAAALRQAQIRQRDKKSRQAPYYWAGFQIQGDWKP